MSLFIKKRCICLKNQKKGGVLMNGSDMIVNGFSFMPPSLSAWIGKSIPDVEFSGDIPWTALKKPISETTFSLMTSAGINRRTDPPFDMEREKREPVWGDPTHREIPSNSSEADIDANHLHIDTAFIKEDINVMLPLSRFGEFEREGVIGRLAPTAYSYYGFQLDPKILIAETMPRVAAKMHEEGVEAVLLTPA
jgi:D-proline reductase (dithiol) PrdB